MVPNWPIFNALTALKRAKVAQHGLNMGSFQLFVHPKWSSIILGKKHFDPFLTHFWFQNNQFSRHFVILEGPKWLELGSKRAHFTYLCTPNGLGSFLEDTFLTHF